MLVAVIKFLTPATEIAAQVNSNPWPILGNVGIGAAANPQRMLNIHGVGITGNASDPTIRLSYNQFNADAYEPEFMGHLSLITSPYNQFTYSYCRDFFGAYQTTVKDLVLQNGLKAGDIIVATRNENGYIRFATTPLPTNPDSLRPGDYQDVERLAITPSGQIGIGTHSPIGKFDVNFGSWNCELPKISFSNNPVSGATGHTIRPSIRFYTPTGIYQSDDNPPIPLSCEQIPARAWWLEAWNESPGSFHIRSGVNSLNTTKYGNPIGEEIPISRMSFLGNGNVGVNQENPKARFQVTDGSVLFDGESGATPTSGAGTRLMWIPDKAAFRAGRLTTDETETPDATDYWNNANIGYYSVAMGLNTFARGGSSGAFGRYTYINGDALDQGLGHCSFALGHQDTITGNDAFVTGWRNHVRGLASAAFGHGSEVFNSMCYSIGEYVRTGDTASLSTFDKQHNVGIGAFLNAIGKSSMIIGTGIDFSKRLTNSIPNSLMLGFNSDKSTLFVSGGDGSSSSFGKVGIGTTNPAATLGVNGSVVIGWDGENTPNDANTQLVVEKKVGIGTASPQCSLGVNGSVCFGWEGDINIPSVGNTGNPIGGIIEHSVIIGGTGIPLAPAYIDGDRSGKGSLLQVWGDAVKLGSGGTASWDIPSDARYKKDVRPYTDGLNLLKRINPVRFKYNEKLGIKEDKECIGVLAQDIQSILPYTVREDTLRRIIRTKAERKYQIDTIERIVKKIADTMTIDVSGHYPYKDTIILQPKKKWVVEPAEFITESTPLLVFNPSAMTYTIINSIKELDSMFIAGYNALEEKVKKLEKNIEDIVNTNDSLRQIIENHEGRLARLEIQNQIPANELSDIILDQNNPNPFAETTIITYYIPKYIHGDAELLITPANQYSILQRYTLTKGVPSQISVSANDLYTGVFAYSISINGKILASKKFIIIK